MQNYLKTPYGFGKHINNRTGKENIYLIVVTNNFLKVLVLIILIKNHKRSNLKIKDLISLLKNIQVYLV
jgi:hypothetical protein